MGKKLERHQVTPDELKHWQHDIVDFFERKGVRWTPQRQLVLDSLQRTHGHISAEQIHHDVIRQFPKVNLSTIYRTLEMLCEMGVMVEVVSRNDDRKRFELVGEVPHYHLVCEICGDNVELEPSVIERLKTDTLERYGFKLELNHFVGHGLCKHCREIKS